MSRPPRVSVIGAGSWGTTVAALTSHNAPTLLWARRPELAAQIAAEHVNGDYLPDDPLPESLRATSSLEEAIEYADVLVLAVPSHGLRAVLEQAAPRVRPWIPVVSLVKGLERGTRLRMTEIVAQILPGHPAGILAGPNLAREVMQGYAAAAVIAMPDHSVAQALQSLFARPMFRVYTGDDVIGVELAGALKNVVAIAAGMADGLDAGDNTRATVITRSLAELTRLGVALGGQERTFAGLAGMGDLIATCISPLSRNRRVGVEIAKGHTIEEITKEMKMVAEGVKTARVIIELAELHGVEMPIAREVDAVVNEGRSAFEAFRGLLRTEAATEYHPG